MRPPQRSRTDRDRDGCGGSGNSYPRSFADSFLTYGSLDDESATAPGQLTARELREVYRIDHLDEQTEIMGLIGRPVTHSISPHLHNASFAASGTNAVYIPF